MNDSASTGLVISLFFNSDHVNSYQTPHPPITSDFKHLLSYNSKEDTCKNCAKCGKGFKIGANEAYNIKIKIRLGGISKIFYSCSHANMAASDKGISLKNTFLKKFLLNVTNSM